MVGLRRLRATGQGLAGRILITIPLFTITLAIGQSLMDILMVPTSSPLYMVTDLVWPLSMILTFIVSIAVLLARQIPGWHRPVPLLCDISLPLSIGLMLLSGQELPGWVFGLHMA